MIFPSPGLRHPVRCFWVAIWNASELTGLGLVRFGISPGWLFGKCLGKPGRRIK